MKKFLIIAVFILSVVTVSRAADIATFGDYNSSNVYRLTANTDGTLTYASDTSIKYPYKSYTSKESTSVQLVTTDSGRVIIDFGTAVTGSRGYGNKFVLPPSAVGLKYTIAVGAYNYVTVDTYSTSDKILYTVSNSPLDLGDSIKSAGVTGDSVTVSCPYSGYWVIESMFGTWTDNGTN